MSTKEIFELRKAGKHDEAYAMAKALIAEQPADAWNIRAWAWVLIDHIKASANDNEKDEALETLFHLTIPIDDAVLREQMGWMLRKQLFELPKTVNHREKISEILHRYTHLKTEKPSKLHSAILSALFFHADHFDKIPEVLQWWDKNNFREEDYLSDTNEKGDTFPSLHAKAMRILGKTLKGRAELTDEMRGWAVKTLGEAVIRYPDDEWLPYYHGLLLIRFGDKTSAQKELLPLIKRKQQQFWAWELLAHLCDKTEDQCACYCQALLCRAVDESFLVHVRYELACCLMTMQLTAAARNEIALVLRIRKQKGWRVPEEVQDLAVQLNITEEQAVESNASLYTTHANRALELLLQDVPSVIGVVSHINMDKKLSRITFGANKDDFVIAYHASFPHASFLQEEGSFVTMKVERNTQRDRNVVLAVSATQETPAPSFCRTIKGSLRKKEDHPYGFVDDVFISPPLVTTHNLIHGKDVQVLAVYEWNDKKSASSWRALKVL